MAKLSVLSLKGTPAKKLELPDEVFDSPLNGALIHEAVLAYSVFTPEVRHPVEVPAEQEAHLVKWLSKRLGAEIKAPRLQPVGYDLVGGRLLSASSGPAALFMYQNEAGRRLTLYLSTAGAGIEETAFRYVHEAGIGVFYWIDGPLGYAIAGEMDKPKLLEVANLIYRQINP